MIYDTRIKINSKEEEKNKKWLIDNSGRNKEFKSFVE